MLSSFRSVFLVVFLLFFRSLTVTFLFVMPLVPILMPQLGESIAEATVVNLLVEPGEQVDVDQEIIEVETQKATMAVPTLCAGVIHEFHIEEGETYPVGHVLGVIEATQEEVDAHGLETLDSAGAAAKTDVDESKAEAEQKQEQTYTGKAHFSDVEDAAPPSAEPDAVSTSVQPNVEGLPVPVHPKGANYLSPRLKARMEELGLRGADLANVAGSGRAGRVTVDDLERFLEYVSKYPSSEASPMRRAVADSMQRSWSRPLATVGLSVKMEPLLAHRRSQDPKPGVTLYAIRALAIALTEFPAAAGHLIGRKIFTPDTVDIGFAVEVEGGVLVPKLRSVEKKSLQELMQEYQRLLALAQNRQLTEEDQKGGIATVTNIGTFGLTWGTPVPPPTESVTMALCTARQVPLWNQEEEKFVPSLEAELCLAFDHRVIDGGAGGRVLGRVRELMENPQEL